MVCGIGMDLCSVDRIKNLAHKESFIRKYFSKLEQEYIIAKGASADQTTAGMFAAKEAFVKMLGTGFINADLRSIEILHDKKGKPYICTNGWAKHAVEERFISCIFLSISHEQNIAGAYVLAEMSDECVSACRCWRNERQKLELLAEAIGCDITQLDAHRRLEDIPEYDYSARKKIGIMLKVKFHVRLDDLQISRFEQVDDILHAMQDNPGV